MACVMMTLEMEPSVYLLVGNLSHFWIKNERHNEEHG